MQRKQLPANVLQPSRNPFMISDDEQQHISSQSGSPGVYPTSSSPPLPPARLRIMYNIFILSVSFLALLQTLSVLGQGVFDPFVPRSVSSQSDSSFEDAFGAGIPPPLLNVLRKYQLKEYPTSFTKGIIPKFLHSHNDYWRAVPFFSALAAGAVSVEVDIWLFNGTLYVGHEVSALTTKRTFESLYVNPILNTLKRQNPTTDFIDRSDTLNGVFDTDSAQTLYLWLDIKTSSGPTFAAAIKALEPLHKRGYLTSYSTKSGTIPGPVTVIGTGGTPLAAVKDISPRYYFWDAPLADLDSDDYADITSDISPIASTSFAASGFANVGRHGAGGPVFSTTELETMRAQIAVAKERGIGARYWDTPGWPVRTRNAVWRTLWEEGAALVNVDDLADAAFGRWAT